MGIRQEGNIPLESQGRVEKARQRLSLFKEQFDPPFGRFLQQQIDQAKEISPEVADLLQIGVEFALAGGKRIRPTFVFEGHKAVGGENEDLVIFGGIAVELLHAAALVHDDIIDNSDLRRGRPTVHRQIAERLGDEETGKSIAIVVGDSLLAMANSAATSFNHVPSARAQFDTMCSEINYGQYLDILGNERRVNEEWILKVMEYKTARYTILRPIFIGASLGGASEEVLRSLSGYAIPLGIAFQIQDDILGMFGSPERVGKPTDSDLKEGKITVLILETRRVLEERRRLTDLQRLDSIVGNPLLTTEDNEWVRRIIVETGVFEYSRKLAKGYINQAQKALSRVPLPPDSLEYFLGIAEFMLQRDY